jgi:undecaprenyl-diphosphatase
MLPAMTNAIATAVLAGVVEGVTEFLPVSSTGHLILVERLVRQPCSDLFNIVIQSGAVLAVLPLFRARLSQFLFCWSEPATWQYAAKLALAFLVTAVGGLALNRVGFRLPEEAMPIAAALAIGGLGFLAVEAWLARRSGGGCEEVTWKIAVLVGVAQLLAGVFPGTSRSGATILFSLVLGMSRPAATEFSFLVGIPTMLAAGGLKILGALRHAPADAPPESWTMVAVGFVVSALVSFVVVKWLLGYIRTHTFVVFGWYRLALAAVIALLAAGGWL